MAGNSNKRNIPICIFAKPPVAGHVKTRLAAAIGAGAAAELAAAMLSDTWATIVSTPGADAVLAVTEDGEFPRVVRTGTRWLQGEGDLGARLERILRRGIERAGAAIAVGADSPLLSSDHLASGIALLTTEDAVIGPALDGGYYLLGLRACPPGMLADLRWSTPETRERTEERLRQRGMSVRQLEPLPDVDVAEDLLTLIEELGASSAHAPHTRQWIAKYAPILGGISVG
ncbi:MAG: TIGR04282 family arsenosugar biosynthesis glycosyltransferase [Acidobacteriaceae bacterium]|nr:TIGR04282 family arsenosugar biosynthesis glycosyltransferase [Acidobacteriaceae bacterium]